MTELKWLLPKCECVGQIVNLTFHRSKARRKAIILIANTICRANYEFQNISTSAKSRLLSPCSLQSTQAKMFITNRIWLHGLALPANCCRNYHTWHQSLVLEAWRELLVYSAAVFAAPAEAGPVYLLCRSYRTFCITSQNKKYLFSCRFTQPFRWRVRAVSSLPVFVLFNNRHLLYPQELSLLITLGQKGLHLLMLQKHIWRNSCHIYWWYTPSLSLHKTPNESKTVSPDPPKTAQCRWLSEQKMVQPRWCLALV